MMEGEQTSREHLLGELAQLRRRVAELEASDAEHGRAEGALARYREGLEALVDERTAELGEANATLEEQLAERIRAEGALAAERNLLRTLIDNLPDPVFVKDAQGRYIATNPAHAPILGVDPEQAIGKTTLDLRPDDLFARYAEANDLDVLRSGQAILNREQPVVDSQGRERWFLTSKMPFRDASGSVVGLVGVSRDITERKRAEEALQEYSERLEEMVEERTKELRETQDQLVRKERLAVLGALSGAVGHELRNPLGSIRNGVYYLKMVLADADPEVKDTLDIVDLEATKCTEIIHDLLDFARARPPVRVRVDANHVVRETLSRTTVPENIEVIDNLDEALPQILADAVQLGQVFGNIITNALQAMPQGGRLVVSSQAVEGEYVAVSFSDTGTGISEENLERVFEPLFTTKARGIGLGLMLCKMLVESHGGTIEVQSELGKGSTFTVRLPIGATPGPLA